MPKRTGPQQQFPTGPAEPDPRDPRPGAPARGVGPADPAARASGPDRASGPASGPGSGPASGPGAPVAPGEVSPGPSGGADDRREDDRRISGTPGLEAHRRPDTDIGGGNYGAGKVWGEETPLRTDAHGRPLEGPDAHPRAPEPAVRTDITGRRRTGTEPRNAKSDLDLRLYLSAVFAPLFLIGAIVLALLAAHAGANTSPSRTVYVVLATVCAALMVIALGDLAAVQRRRRRRDAALRRAAARQG